MSRQTSRRCLCTFQVSLQASRGAYIGKRIAGTLLVALLSASLTYGAGSLTPPPPPKVLPIISGTYSTDLNGNRIADSLELAPGQVSIASDERVEVELIFKEPISQHQIDEFLRLGGQITYLYEAISYGWNGWISRGNIAALPAAMGPTLVQVEAVQQVRYCMDTATQTGRVRPIWKAGFAGVAGGVRGDPNTTIAFLGNGVDGTHADLQGRCVYWKDISADNEPAPVDYDGHDTLVAGIATGTGAAGGADDGELRFTYTYADASYPTYIHATDPISLPANLVTIKASAWWTGQSQSVLLDLAQWTRGTDFSNIREVGSWVEGKSPLTLTNTLTGSPNNLYTTILEDYATQKPVENVTIVISVNPYPGVGDGFNKFSGVAPGCKWAAAQSLRPRRQWEFQRHDGGPRRTREDQCPEEHQDHHISRRLLRFWASPAKALRCVTRSIPS